MDASYWAGIPVNPPTNSRPTVSEGSRLNVNSSGVIDLGPSVSLPYATIGTGFDVSSAASLEFLLNQQRLAAASGLSFLPYSAGATYAQVFDGTSNASSLNTHNVLAYSAIAGQSAFPGLFYDPGQVTTSQNIAASTQQYKTMAAAPAGGTALVVPSFSSASSSLSGLSASTSTVCNAAVSSASSSYIYQPTVIKQSGPQPITLSDLIEYGIIPFDQHSVEAVSRPSLPHVVNSRSQQVSAQMAHPLDVRNQSVPTHVLQSTQNAVNYVDYKQNVRREQIRVPEPRHQIPAASTLATATRRPPSSLQSQPVTNQAVPGVMPFFRPSVAASRPIAPTSFAPQSTVHTISHNPPSVPQSQQPTTYTAPVQTSNKQQTLPPVSSALVWPYMDASMLVSDSQGQLLVPPAGFTLSLGNGIADMQQESNVTDQVTYEAVSPAAGSTDILPFNFLDNFHFVTTDPSGGIQLGNFLGSTVDTSALFAPVSQASGTGIPSSSQHNANINETQATNFKPNSALLQNGSTNSAAGDLRTNEADKSIKPKANLGIVLPMTHGREASIANKSDAVVSDDKAQSQRCSQLSAQQSYDYQNSYMSSDQQSLYDKTSSVPLADGSATGGIVLTNITGNVYVNQYTMLPGGGVQPIDNALLHADLGFPYQTAYTDSSGNEAYIVQQQVQPASNVSVMVHTDVDEIGHFAVDPASAATSVTPLQEKPKTVSNMDSYQSLQRLSTINTAFLSPESLSAPISAVPPVKPSNQFESSFLKFICGHKAETLSSVLNSPIRSRPELPKYIPEVRRARSISVVEPSVADDCSKNAEDIADNEKSGQTESDAQVTDSSNSVTPDNNSGTTTTQDTASTEWPTVTKLPAKFSHKWKNRTSLTSDHPSSAAAANAAVTVTKVTVIDNVKSPANSSTTISASAGKSKGNSASSNATTPASGSKSKGNTASSGATTPASTGRSKGNSASSSASSSKTKSSSAAAGSLPSGGKNKSVITSSNTQGSKTKSSSDVQWTVSKKSKSSASQQTGLRLVLKAVAAEPTGSSKSSAKTS